MYCDGRSTTQHLAERRVIAELVVSVELVHVEPIVVERPRRGHGRVAANVNPQAERHVKLDRGEYTHDDLYNCKPLIHHHHASSSEHSMSSSSSSQAVAAAGGVATDRQTAVQEKEKGEGNEWRLDLTDKIAGPFLFLMGGFMYNRLVWAPYIQTTYRGRIKLISLWEQ